MTIEHKQFVLCQIHVTIPPWRLFKYSKTCLIRPLDYETTCLQRPPLSGHKYSEQWEKTCIMRPPAFEDRLLLSEGVVVKHRFYCTTTSMPGMIPTCKTSSQKHALSTISLNTHSPNIFPFSNNRMDTVSLCQTSLPFQQSSGYITIASLNVTTRPFLPTPYTWEQFPHLRHPHFPVILQFKYAQFPHIHVYICLAHCLQFEHSGKVRVGLVKKCFGISFFVATWSSLTLCAALMSPQRARLGVYGVRYKYIIARYLVYIEIY